MPNLRQLSDPALARLERATFAGLDVVEHGLVVLEGAESWGAHERGYLELPAAEGIRRVAIAYDEREAPFATDAQGAEQTDLLLSLTDEGDRIACLWARVGAGSRLLGVGVDLSDTSHFDERPPRANGQPARDLSLLLFTDHERSLLDALDPADPPMAKAALFAAKEAAFKATAAPLRRWYDRNTDELLFEVRHFVMEEPGLERGTGRNAAAQAALDRMGVGRIEVRHEALGSAALVTAVALSS